MTTWHDIKTCIVTSRVTPSDIRDLADADVILGWSFGSPYTCKSNIALACIGETLHQIYGLPLVVQWELADCLRKLLCVSVAHSVQEHTEPGKYLDTREVGVQQANHCIRRGWRKAIILAHPDQQWRCAQTASQLGFSPHIPDTSSVAYDWRSTQFWTKAGALFVPYDRLARLDYLRKGWI